MQKKLKVSVLIQFNILVRKILLISIFCDTGNILEAPLPQSKISGWTMYYFYTKWNQLINDRFKWPSSNNYLPFLSALNCRGKYQAVFLIIFYFVSFSFYLFSLISAIDYILKPIEDITKHICKL